MTGKLTRKTKILSNSTSFSHHSL